jgi:phosphate/sulfate permease
MMDIYNQIVLISTAAAVVTAAIALLMMNFSKNSRTVDESRTWLKRIVTTWIILNSLGFVVAYLTPILSDGKWTG